MLPYVQSVLFKSPYSGCAQFSGWKKAACGTIPSPYWPAQNNAPGARMCVDRFRKAQGLPVLQRVHYRPSRPYPGAVCGAGGEALKPAPRIVRPTPPKPAYNLHAIAGPSATGPYTFGIARGICGAVGPDMVVGSGSGAGGGSGPG